MVTLAPPRVAIRTVPIVKTVLYAGLASELVANSGMKDAEQIGALQEVVSQGLVAKVIVRARHPDGHETTATLAFKPFGAGDSVMLETEAGKSFCEMLDPAFAAVVHYIAELKTRLKLTPRFEIDWSEKAKANPHLVTTAARRLNVKGPVPPPPPPAPPEPPVGYQTWGEYFHHNPPPTRPEPPQERYPQTVHTHTAPPPLPPGTERVTLLEITPEKDPGVTLTLESTRKK